MKPQPKNQNPFKNSAFCILHSSFLILLFILHSTFYIPTPASAAGIIPIPGTSCNALQGADKDDCNELICPKGPPQRVCVAGQCLVEGQTGAGNDNLPCNFTLDDLVLTGVNMSNFIFGIMGALLLMFIAYGGYQMLISVGNPEDIQKARGTLTNAFIGVILITGAVVLVRFAALLLGSNLPEGPKGSLQRIPVCIKGGCPDGMSAAEITGASPCEADQVYCVSK